MRYKFDVLSALKEAGYNTNYIRINKLLNENTLQKFRHKQTDISVKTLETLCRLLDCQPGDILEYVPDDEPNKDE
ncbi:MAG: helix-turn-helix transcriptional regulator [Oscillospiraceae bacterium]|nr:helix-turn-helix transcriptional regulator [Oscillospiraceae bacterium]